MDDIDDIVEDVQDVAESVMQLGVKKTLGFAGILSGIFGFVADVLQPIAPVAIYLFIAALILLVVSLVWYLKSKKGLVLAIVSLCATVVLGGVTLIQRATDATEEGVAAKVVPGISDLQKSLGVIGKDVEEVKKNTEEIKTNTAEIKEDTKKVVENTEKVAKNTDTLVDQGKKTQESLEKIGDAVESVANNGGIKKSPTSAEDFYHNAKIYELNGDYGNAKRAYKSYFGFKTGKLDPHLRLTDFLRVNEGRAGAREMYEIIVKGNETPVSKFVDMTLIPSRDLRLAKMAKFSESNPKFTPATYYLSKEYSLDRLGKQSFSDKRNEYKWLTAFKQADDNGELVKYFVDKELLGSWQQDVKERLKAADAYVHQLKNPVTVSWMSHNAGFNGYINILEPTIKIEYREAGKGEFKGTGYTTNIHPMTGKKMPNSNLSLPLDQEPTEFEVRYTDVSGNVSDVYIIKLEEKHVKGVQVKDGKVEIDQNALNIVKMTKTSWISFREWDGKTLVYFTGVLGHRGILKEIKYGVDKEEPDKNWKFKPYNKAGFAPIDAKMKLTMSVPKTTKFVTVKLKFKDDTESEVVKFNNPAAK